MNPIASDNPTRDDEPRNIVMHVNFADPERLNMVLNNVENILDHFVNFSKIVLMRATTAPDIHFAIDVTLITVQMGVPDYPWISKQQFFDFLKHRQVRHSNAVSGCALNEKEPLFVQQ